MDLSEIKPSTVDVEILHPGTGEPTGLVISLVSLSDDRVKAAQRQLTDEAIQAQGRTLTAAEIDENGLRLRIAAVAGWVWNDGASWGGKTLDFTPANVRSVIEAGWVRKQLDRVLDRDASFFQPPQKGSKKPSA